MSDEAAQEIIKRAVREDAFREQLVKDFDGATSPYLLTEEEKKALKSIDWSSPLPVGTGVMGTWVHVYKTSSV